MTPFGDYCAYTKAVHHLGDRWSLVIVRELAIHGRLGFNALAATMPGISRSVLARRLRKLQDLGLIARDDRGVERQPPYRLAPAGQHLVPTLLSLREWAERWVPADSTMAERDPDVIVWWLGHRVDPEAVPQIAMVLVFDIGAAPAGQTWLVVERDTDPSLCMEDPGMAPERYVYVEADADTLLPISRGERDWRSSIVDRSVRLFGEPDLVRVAPSLFRPAIAQMRPFQTPTVSKVIGTSTRISSLG